ncbi:high affinity cationic amino acid transporter 1-like [Convolutriloba macropyga]|uniref:high affinity cationic amino acid transporter 1-like n=1 Tax=Convolutriloba macropyga TaxID=536237 RepID=UPI003F51CE2C
MHHCTDHLEYLVLSLASFLPSLNKLRIALSPRSIATQNTYFGVVAYLNDATSEAVLKATPSFLESFDLYSVLLVLLITIIACIGVKLTSLVNDALSLLNLATLTFVAVSGFVLADWHNWTDNFLPNGVSSVFTGAAEIYFASGGYDVVNIATEEAINPAKSVPIALFTAVAFITTLLCSISAAVTLMIPYKDIAQSVALSQALEYNGWGWASVLVTIGAVVAMASTVMANTMCSSRIIYGMASEGLIFRGLSRVNKITQIPIWATLVASSLSAVVAFFIELKDLAQMLAFGALLAFSCVALIVIKVRCDSSTATFYNRGDEIVNECSEEKFDLEKEEPENDDIESQDTEKIPLIKKQKKQGKDWNGKHTITTALFLLFMGLSVCCLATIQAEDQNNEIILWCAIGVFFFFFILMIASIVYLWCFISEPAQFSDSNFRVPLLPVIPVVSIFVNFYLITQLTKLTWIRSCIWMLIGFVVYFTYGVNNSGVDKE